MNTEEFKSRWESGSTDISTFDKELQQESLRLEQRAKDIAVLAATSGWKHIKEAFELTNKALIETFINTENTPEEDKRIKDTIRARNNLISLIESFK